MAVLLPGKLLYLAHHCVASWSTTEALRSMGGEYVDVGLDQKQIGLSHHAPFDVAVRHCDYRGEPVVSTVRDPYDAWVTEWCRQGCPDGTLERYLERLHRGRLPFRRWQKRAGEFFWHVPMSDVVMRYETLDEDWRRLCDALGLSHVPLPHRNVSQNRPALAHTPQSIQLINEIYGPEIRALGYEVRDPDSIESVS